MKQKMKAPAGASSVSVQGTEYEVDEAGFVEVSIAHVADVQRHGYTIAEDKPKKPAMKAAADPDPDTDTQSGGSGEDTVGGAASGAAAAKKPAAAKKMSK